MLEETEVAAVVRFYSEELLDWKTYEGRPNGRIDGWRKEGIEGGEKVGIQDSSLCFGGVDG